jgi:hypothetical protein
VPDARRTIRKVSQLADWDQESFSEDAPYAKWDPELGKFIGASPESIAQTYTHQQSQASTTWTITHNLGRRPSVTIVDSAGDLVRGDVRYVSDDQVVLTFSAAFGGYAYLN